MSAHGLRSPDLPPRHAPIHVRSIPVPPTLLLATTRTGKIQRNTAQLHIKQGQNETQPSPARFVSCHRGPSCVPDFARPLPPLCVLPAFRFPREKKKAGPTFSLAPQSLTSSALTHLVYLIIYLSSRHPVRSAFLFISFFSFPSFLTITHHRTTLHAIQYEPF